MLKSRKRQRLSSVLGLALDGSRLEGVLLRRTNGSLQLQQAFAVTLTLDPLTAAAELVGREIRNHLDAAGIKEKNCVMAAPLKWALTAHVELPELAETDVASFLQLEGERAFPCDVSTLEVCTSRCRAAGREHALMIGIPRNHLTLLENALRAAKLRPLEFSLGALALPNPDPPEEVLSLLIGETSVGLQVTCGGGVAALRALEGALQLEGGKRALQPEAIARETRITLGQLPPDLRQRVRSIRIFGPRDLSRQLADELELRLETLGLPVAVIEQYSGNEFGLHLPPETVVSPALTLAARRLAGRPNAFDFLPPRVTALQRIASRYASGRVRMAGAAAALAALVIILLYLVQQWQLMSLQRQWNAMAPKVQELEAVQQQVRQYRPWFDESRPGLSILKQLTQAFPEEASVSAKTVEIRDPGLVTCTGTARDNQALLKTLERLRASGSVTDLKVNQIRGKSPMQFTFDFRWSEGGKP